MRSWIRTFLLLPALILAMVAIPVLVLSVAGSASGAPLADVSASVSSLDDQSSTAFQSPIPPTRPPGTVPPPTPHPPRPRPRPPVYPTPVPTAAHVADKAMIYPYELEKVIGDRLSPTIYAFTEKGALYRSNDDGSVWYLIRTNLEVDDFMMSSANPDILYSGKGADCADPSAANEPFYQSIDGGYTWEELPTAINLRPLLIDPADPYRLFATDCNMLYLSTDGGMSWMEKPDNSVEQLWNNYQIVKMAAAALVGDPTPEQPHWDQIYAIGVNAEGNSVIAFTGDQGETWANITDANKAPKSLSAIVAQQKQAGALWTTATNGVWATENFGIQWGLTSRGLTTPSTRLNDITYAFNGKLYLATNRGLYEKDINGTIWSKVTGTSFGNEYIVNLLLTESNPTRLWVNTQDEGVFTYRVEEED